MEFLADVTENCEFLSLFFLGVLGLVWPSQSLLPDFSPTTESTGAAARYRPGRRHHFLGDCSAPGALDAHGIH